MSLSDETILFTLKARDEATAILDKLKGQLEALGIVAKSAGAQAAGGMDQMSAASDRAVLASVKLAAAEDAVREASDNAARSQALQEAAMKRVNTVMDQQAVKAIQLGRAGSAGYREMAQAEGVATTASGALQDAQDRLAATEQYAAQRAGELSAAVDELRHAQEESAAVTKASQSAYEYYAASLAGAKHEADGLSEAEVTLAAAERAAAEAADAKTRAVGNAASAEKALQQAIDSRALAEQAVSRASAQGAEAEVAAKRQAISAEQKLAEAYNRAGDANAVATKAIGEHVLAQSRLTQASKGVESELGNVGGDLERVALDFEKATAEVDKLNKAYRDLKTSASGGGGGGPSTGLLPGGANPTAGGIGLAAGALAGPLSGVALGGVIAVFAAIGVAAEKSNADVTAAFSGMTAAAKASLQNGFLPLVPALVTLANEGKAAVQELEPVFRQAATAMDPLLEAVGSGFIKATQQGIGAAVPILQRLGPVAEAIGQDFIKLEQAIGGFLAKLDVSTAAQGLSVLGDVVQKLLPDVAVLLNLLGPLGNAILPILAQAVHLVVNALSLLQPIINAVAGVLTALSPALSPALVAFGALALATKLLTGSFTDFGGAISKVTGFFSSFSGASREAAVATATLKDAEAAAALAAAKQAAAQDGAALASAKAAQANLAAGASAEEVAVANKAVAGAAIQNAASQGALAEAEQAAAASNVLVAETATTAAEAEGVMGFASRALELALGPVGIGLALVGAMMLVMGHDAQQAQPPLQATTADLVGLSQAAPAAASGLVAGNQALQATITLAQKAGVNVQAMLDAYAGGPDTLRAFDDAQHKLADTMNQAGMQIGFTRVKMEDVGVTLFKMGMTVKDLAPANQKLYDQWLSMHNLLPTLDAGVGDLAQQQSALNDIMQNAGTAAQQVAAAMQSYATGVNKAAQTAATSIQPTETLFKAQLAAAQGVQQLNDTYGQNGTLARAVADATDGVARASQGLTSALGGVASAAQAVANAQHGEITAAQAVVSAQQGVASAVHAVQQAQLAYNSSLQAEQAAQQSLMAARAAAAQQLIDLRLQLVDSTNSEASAQLAVFDAQQAVNAAGLQNSTLTIAQLAAGQGLNASNEASYKLLLALAQAKAQLNDSTNSGTVLQNQANTAFQQGVNGAPGVVSAQQAVASAQQGVANSAYGIITANQGLVSANQAVSNAQYAQQQAHLATQAALVAEGNANIAVQNAQDALRKANDALSGAQDNNTRSLDINTSSGANNTKSVLDLFDQNLATTGSVQQATKMTEQETTALGFNQTAVDILVGNITGNFQPVLSSLTNVSLKQAYDMLMQNYTAMGQDAGQAQNMTNKLLGIPPNVSFDVNGAGHLDTGQVNQIFQWVNGSLQTFTKDYTSGPGRMRAMGGPIFGPGGPTDDVIPIMASAGEYMQPAHAVDYYGSGAMEAIRRHAIPRAAFGHYAGGGLINSFPGGTPPFAVETMGGLGAAAQTAAGDVMGAVLANAMGASFPIPSSGSGALDLSALMGWSATPSGGFGNMSGIRGSAAANRQIVLSIFSSMFGWGSPAEQSATDYVEMRESGYNNVAQNPTSTAYGMFQFLNSTWAGYGIPKTSDPTQQAIAGGRYIRGRYGDPIGAAAHERAFNWYDQGGYLPDGGLGANASGGPEMVLPPNLTDLLEDIHERYTALGTNMRYRDPGSAGATYRGGHPIIGSHPPDWHLTDPQQALQGFLGAGHGAGMSFAQNLMGDQSMLTALGLGAGSGSPFGGLFLASSAAQSIGQQVGGGLGYWNSVLSGAGRAKVEGTYMGDPSQAGGYAIPPWHPWGGGHPPIGGGPSPRWPGERQDDGDTHYHNYDFRGAQIRSSRDIDDIVDKIGQNLRRTLPQAGVRVRR